MLCYVLKTGSSGSHLPNVLESILGLEDRDIGKGWPETGRQKESTCASSLYCRAVGVLYAIFLLFDDILIDKLIGWLLAKKGNQSRASTNQRGLNPQKKKIFVGFIEIFGVLYATTLGPQKGVYRGECFLFNLFVYGWNTVWGRPSFHKSFSWGLHTSVFASKWHYFDESYNVERICCKISRGWQNFYSKVVSETRRTRKKTAVAKIMSMFRRGTTPQ